MRRDLDHVAANDVEAGQTNEQILAFPRRQPAYLRRSGARGEGGIEAVDVETHVDRPLPHDLSRPGDHCRHAHGLEFLDVDNRHAGVIGEFPDELGGATDADLDAAPGIDDAIEHGVTHGGAVIELGLVELAARVAMGVDVHQAHGLLAAHRLEYGMADRVIAADTERPYPGGHQF